MFIIITFTIHNTNNEDFYNFNNKTFSIKKGIISKYQFLKLLPSKSLSKERGNLENINYAN